MAIHIKIDNTTKSSESCRQSSSLTINKFIENNVAFNKTNNMTSTKTIYPLNARPTCHLPSNQAHVDETPRILPRGSACILNNVKQCQDENDLCR